MDFNLLEPFVKASVRDKMKYMLMGNVSVMMDTGNLSVNVNLFAKKMKNGGMENVSVKLGSTLSMENVTNANMMKTILKDKKDAKGNVLLMKIISIKNASVKKDSE